MNDIDKERFSANFEWFNQFFSDLHQLLENISKTLVNKFSWETDPKNWYYEKWRYQPTFPQYYVTALSGGTFAVQIYAVFNLSLLENHPVFTKEPCLVIVKHSRGDRVLWLNNYGLRVIGNTGISLTRMNDKVITGEILAGEGEGTSYAAFQVLLGSFSKGEDIDAVIKQEIVEVIGMLPDW